MILYSPYHPHISELPFS